MDRERETPSVHGNMKTFKNRTTVSSTTESPASSIMLSDMLFYRSRYAAEVGPDESEGAHLRAGGCHILKD